MKNFKTELKIGFLIASFLGVYFLIIESAGLSNVAFLRLFNIVFVIVGINISIKTNLAKGNTGYLENFGSSIVASFSGIVISIVGLWCYVSIFKDDLFLKDLASSVILNGEGITLTQFCVALLIEGLASTLVLVFISMQYWKNVTHTSRVPFFNKI